MLAQRLQAKPEPHEDPLLCGRLLQQDFCHFLTISLDNRRVATYFYSESGNFPKTILSASRLLLCFFWSCASKFNGCSLFPLSHAATSHYPAVSPRNILTKWQPPIWLGYRKAGVLHALLQLRLQSLHKHDFISNQIVVLLLINTTTLQLQCFLLTLQGKVLLLTTWKLVRGLSNVATTDVCQSGFQVLKYHCLVQVNEIISEIYIA